MHSVRKQHRAHSVACELIIIIIIIIVIIIIIIIINIIIKINHWTYNVCKFSNFPKVLLGKVVIKFMSSFLE